MGLMDNIKKAQEMAQQEHQSGGNMPAGAMPDAADMEYAQTANKIAQSGLPGVATINAISETGKTDAGVNKQYAIGVSIELDSLEKVPAEEPSHECDARMTLSTPERPFAMTRDLEEAIRENAHWLESIAAEPMS